jgi:signal transduction histidine kinase
MTDPDLANLPRGLYRLVDWFIPGSLQRDEVIDAVRMFLFSHLFGPFLGLVIAVYLLFVQGTPNLAWWVFFGSLTALWPLPFVLRATGWYVPLALLSIQNLMFCILWGCYHYGGINSPILPWLLAVPLLAFFYLPSRQTRIMVSLLIAANLLAFYIIYEFSGSETLPLNKLVGLGLVSTFCEGIYVTMMALYYAGVVSSQSELEEEVRRHRETESQLRQATEHIERATRAKSEFLAKMSHELRNPLNAIIGYSEMLMEDSPGPAQKYRDLQSIRAAGHRLLELVNDLLDLSKLEAGKMELCPKKFSHSEFVGQVAVEWGKRVADAGRKFQLERPAELGNLFGDPDRLRQALSHLLNNATHHSGADRITLTTSCSADWVTFTVSDTGTGISAERLANLFETFGNRSNETSSNYGDTPGLGLPLTRKLCRLMGGDLLVESQPGRGSAFTVRIPTRLPQNARSPAQSGSVPRVRPSRSPTASVEHLAAREEQLEAQPA